MAKTDAGVLATRVTWTTTDPDIVKMTASKEGLVVEPIAPGRAVITARAGNAIAHATVTVIESPHPEPGTTNWALAPLVGLSTPTVLRLDRIDDEGADAVIAAKDPAGALSVVRAVTARGEELWHGVVPGEPWFPDAFGGLIARLESSRKAIGRFDRPGGQPVWRYDSEHEIADAAPDGQNALFLLEHGTAAVNGRATESAGFELKDADGIALEHGHL